MRINTSGLHPARGSDDLSTDARRGAALAPTPGGRDAVTLSPRAQLAAVARRALSEAAEVRADAVERARARLAANEGWDARQLAAAMIRAVAENQV